MISLTNIMNVSHRANVCSFPRSKLTLFFSRQESDVVRQYVKRFIFGKYADKSGVTKPG